MKIGIIGGSGYNDFPAMEKSKPKKIKTPYGSVKVKVGKYKGKTIYFLPRHGFDYSTPPHRINNRANIEALRKEGADYILSTAACGAINTKMKPGDLVIITDFIDFTMNRIETFNLYREPVFTDVSAPYDKNLRGKLLKVAKALKQKVHPKATYICTEGPRFESPAEIKAFGKLGADIVGMTNVPECVLANEAKIPYAALAIVTNYAAGISKGKLSSKEVFEMVKTKSQVITKIFEKVIESL